MDAVEHSRTLSGSQPKSGRAIVARAEVSTTASADNCTKEDLRPRLQRRSVSAHSFDSVEDVKKTVRGLRGSAVVDACRPDFLNACHYAGSEPVRFEIDTALTRFYTCPVV